MTQAVHIENQFPQELTLKGTSYNDTKDLCLKELSLFIERDIYHYLKCYDYLEPKCTLSLLRQNKADQIRLSVSINQTDAIPLILCGLEKILWAFNQQTLVQRNGSMVPLQPRFTYALQVYDINQGQEFFFDPNTGL